MKRRDVLTAGSALLVASRFARAQSPPRIARVGILHQPEANVTFWKPMLEALEALGWKEGRNVTFLLRTTAAGGTDYPRLADELVAEKVDVIVCAGPAPALALKAFGAQVPTVFVIIADPVRLGLAQSLGRPGGNFTGLATMAPDLFLSKQIELLREVVPKARRIAYLLNPDNPVHVQGREMREKVLAAQKLTLIQLQARTKEGLEAAFVEAAKQKAEMMYVGGDLLPMSNRELVARLAIKHRLPTMFLFYEHVEAGGLMSYGIDRADLVRQSAAYVDKILKGASPRDLPIEEPAKYVLMVNLKTAKALGVTVPQTVLLRADKVVE